MQYYLDIYLPILISHPFTGGALLAWLVTLPLITYSYFSCAFNKPWAESYGEDGEQANHLFDVLGFFNVGLCLGIVLILTNLGFLRGIIMFFITHSLGITMIFPTAGNLYILGVLKNLRVRQ